MFSQYSFKTFTNGKQGECITDGYGNDVFCFHTEPEVFLDPENGLSVRFEYVSKYGDDPDKPISVTLHQKDFDNGK